MRYELTRPVNAGIHGEAFEEAWDSIITEYVKNLSDGDTVTVWEYGKEADLRVDIDHDSKDDTVRCTTARLSSAGVLEDVDRGEWIDRTNLDLVKAELRRIYSYEGFGFD